jgi:hypothetical protein
MRIAFIKESDAEALAVDLPKRPIPLQTNLATPTGHFMIDTALSPARAFTGCSIGTVGRLLEGKLAITDIDRCGD